MKGDEERIRAAGCDGYIAKPLAYVDFLTVIAAHLATARRKTVAGMKMSTRPTSLTIPHAF